MGESYASTEDVEAVWRPLTVDETTIASNFLDWVSVKLRRRVPLLDDRIATDDDLEVDVRNTTAFVVARALKNPDGWRQESIDDYSRVRDSAISSGALYVDDGDVGDLMPPVALAGVYSVPLGGPDVWPT